MATNAKSSNNLVRSKPSIGDGPSSSSSKPRIDSSSSSSSAPKKKIIGGSIRNSVPDSRNRSIFSSVATKMTKKTVTATKDDNKKKTVTTTTKDDKKTTVTRREKKVYSLAGQKFDVPEEREPLRIFYESLSKQIPSSEMAEFWLMEHGMLSPERSRKAYEKKQRKQKQLRLGTPIKSPPPSTSSRPESSKRPQQPAPKNGEVKAKKRIMEDSEDDDDFVLSHKRRKG